jgi:hypothetical protein
MADYLAHYMFAERCSCENVDHLKKSVDIVASFD